MGVNLGELPSDALLQELQSFFSPFGEPPQKVIVPKDLRDAINQFVQPSVVALSESGLLPILNQAVHSFEQIPKLVDEVRVEDTVCAAAGPKVLTLTLLVSTTVTGRSRSKGFRTDTVRDANGG